MLVLTLRCPEYCTSVRYSGRSDISRDMDQSGRSDLVPGVRSGGSSKSSDTKPHWIGALSRWAVEGVMLARRAHVVRDDQLQEIRKAVWQQTLVRLLDSTAVHTGRMARLTGRGWRRHIDWGICPAMRLETGLLHFADPYYGSKRRHRRMQLQSDA